jgi:hypothetical protein
MYGLLSLLADTNLVKFANRISGAFPEYVTPLHRPFLKFVILLVAPYLILGEEKRGSALVYNMFRFETGN